MTQNTDLKVFISTSNSSCDECGEDLGRRAWITLTKDKRALCLACAEENPDLTYSLIKEILIGITELDHGASSEYSFG